MALPLYPHGAFGYFTGLLFGTLIGIAFGFVLERAGFGRARNLAAQFYLTDTRVLKVMFSAIVTACVGMAVLAGAGVLDLSMVTVPETFLWPQLVGGLLLGAGFIVSGYCPGTGVVAAASGNLDGVVAILGVMAGSLAFGFAYGPLEGFYRSGAMGVVRIDRMLGVPIAVVAAGIVAMAVGAFLGGEALERIFSRRAGETAPASPARVKTRVFGGFAAAAVVGLALLVLPARGTASSPRRPGSIPALALARQLVAAPDGLWLLDLRAPGPGAERIPGALTLPDGDATANVAAGLAPTRTLVVYAQGDPTSLPEGVTRFGGTVLVLSGGYDAWKATVLTAPVVPDDATPGALAELRLRSALHSHFTGTAAAPPPVAAPRPLAPAASETKKGGGC